MSREQRGISAPQRLAPLPGELQGGSASPQHTEDAQVTGDTFSIVSVFALHSLDPHGTHQQKLGVLGKCLSGSGCKSCSPGIKGLPVHHTASAGFSTQEAISFTHWHFPCSIETHGESTKLRSRPQTATLGLASPIPCEYSSSEVQLIPGTRVL